MRLMERFRRSDAAVAVLLMMAVAFSLGSWAWRVPELDSVPGPLRLAPSLVGFLFLGALSLYLFTTSRGMFIQGLLATGAAILSLLAILFGPEAGAVRLLVFFWIPTVLALAAAVRLGSQGPRRTRVEGL
jgi:hypothetical protein